MLVVGIDPGRKAGGCASIEVYEEEGEPPVVSCHLDVPAYLAWMKQESYPDVRIYLEHVWAWPVDTPTTAFGLGRSYGSAEGALAALGLAFRLVAPQKWQNRLGLKGADKKALHRRAQELYPEAKIPLKYADAVLVAHYGLLQEQAP
jgi:Holliday junction resolvasome RuvABC endonuclease subunit